MNKKIVFYIFITIIWMVIIFIFSSKSPDVSHHSSKTLIKDMVKVSEYVLNKDLDEVYIANKLNYIVRKTAHYSIYLVLGIFIYNLFRCLKIKNKELLSLLCCFLYSVTDEVHQLFVGRSGMVYDVLLDTFGSLSVILFLYYLYNKKNVNRCKRCN